MENLIQTNEQLINHFYTCFQNKDYKGMQDCYADKAIFNDAIFKNLNASQVKAMWQMLLSKSSAIRIEFKDIKATKKTAQAHWDAYYTFSSTGKKVVNRIDATFELENGKITRHTDSFSFYKWAKQALGLSGTLLGWTSFLKRKIQATAMKNLEYFMAKN